MTNYDRIKAMSVDELAYFICGIYDDEEDGAKFINGTYIPAYNQRDIKEWLEREEDREMTDTEIVNALQHCITGHCDGCPYGKSCDTGEKLLRDAQSRIFSLKAEVEDLKTDVADNTETLAVVRYEAIEEFSERLKQRLIGGGIYPVFVKNQIEVILEEMMGGDNQ